MPHLVVKKRSADEVKYVHVTAAAEACRIIIIVVVVEWRDVRAQDTPSEGRDLFRGVELAQIAKVVLADEPSRCVSHRVHVEVTCGGKEVFVVSYATRESR